MCIFSITISWEQTHSSSWIHSVCVCVCVSCDDIVKPCSLRRSQESDLQMRSSWTSKMKYSSVLIRGRTLTEHSNLQPSRNTAMCGRTQNMWPGYYFHIHTSLHRHCLRNIVRLFFFFFSQGIQLFDSWRWWKVAQFLLQLSTEAKKVTASQINHNESLIRHILLSAVTDS